MLDILDRRGLLDAVFFVKLLQRAPAGLTREIEDTAATCGVVLAPPVIFFAAASSRLPVLENLARLRQDIVQLAYAVLTVTGAFLTCWSILGSRSS